MIENAPLPGLTMWLPEDVAIIYYISIAIFGVGYLYALRFHLHQKKHLIPPPELFLAHYFFAKLRRMIGRGPG